MSDLQGSLRHNIDKIPNGGGYNVTGQTAHGRYHELNHPMSRSFNYFFNDSGTIGPSVDVGNSHSCAMRRQGQLIEIGSVGASAQGFTKRAEIKPKLDPYNPQDVPILNLLEKARGEVDTIVLNYRLHGGMANVYGADRHTREGLFAVTPKTYADMGLICKNVNSVPSSPPLTALKIQMIARSAIFD